MKKLLNLKLDKKTVWILIAVLLLNCVVQSLLALKLAQKEKAEREAAAREKAQAEPEAVLEPAPESEPVPEPEPAL